MDSGLQKIFTKQGFALSGGEGTLTGDQELNFAQKCQQLIQDFALSSKSKLGLLEYFSKNFEKYFKGIRSKQEEEISGFCAAISGGKSAEMSMYGEIFKLNISLTASKLFVNIFLSLQNQNSSLYENKHKLLRNIRMDTKRAMQLGSQAVKDQPAALAFNRTFEARAQKAQGEKGMMTADMLVLAVVESGMNEQGSPDEPVLINWNSNDPKTFEVSVVAKPQKKSDKKAKETNKSEEPKNKKENMYKICHDYVWDKSRSATQEHLEEEEDLDKQLAQLKTKLERQKIEYEMQKNLHKLIVNNSKSSVKHYKELKNEIGAVEELVEVTMSSLDKNSEDWRSLFLIRNNELEKLRRFKFLIAAILQNCMQELHQDFKELNPSADFGQVINKTAPQTLRDYIGLLNKYGLATDLQDLIPLKEDSPLAQTENLESHPQEEADAQKRSSKGKYDSLLAKMSSTKPLDAKSSLKNAPRPNSKTPGKDKPKTNPLVPSKSPIRDKPKSNTNTSLLSVSKSPVRSKNFDSMYPQKKEEAGFKPLTQSQVKSGAHR